MEIHPDLIERCKKNERKAQFELYKECYEMMMQICLRYLSNHHDAKALVNQAFLKVCDKVDTYKPEVAFQNWVKRITINTTIDDYRKSKNRKAHFDTQNMNESYWEYQMISVNLVEAGMNAESLRALMQTLPPISQKVFNLCVLDGYDYSEVSEILAVTEATCR